MKAAALLLAGSMALAACASDEDAGGSAASGESSSAAGDLQIGLAYDTGGRGDKSFNDSAYAGASAAAEALGGKVNELTPNADASNRVDLLTQLADDGNNPVIAVGFANADALAEVAPQYPDTTFAIVDSAVEGTGLDNATGLLFAANEGSFLGGVAAALKSTTGHIGFVGGVESPTRPRARSWPRACSRAGRTSSTTRPEAPVRASSRRLPRPAAGRSVSTPTSTRPSVTRPCRP
jgi:basic membrane protein A